MDAFYNRKYGDAVRRLKLLQDQYGRLSDETSGLDREEVQDLMGALLELRGNLRKLQWYGEVNRRGFIKITKKLDKKLPGSMDQRLFLQSKVDPKPFATNVTLMETIKLVNDWLSELGDAKYVDDNSSTHSSVSIPRVPSKAKLNLPLGLLDSIDQSIRNDDASALDSLLQGSSIGHQDPTDHSYQKFLLSLLQRSVSSRSKACIAKLIAFVTSLEELDDINQRNCIHRLVISMSRMKPTLNTEKLADNSSSGPTNNGSFITPAAPPVLAPPSSESREADKIVEFDKDDKAILLLKYILDLLRPEQQQALQARDSYGRMPLHYAAQYGFVAVCKLIISRMQFWGQFEISDGIDAPFWQDMEGRAPLHLSVIGGHPVTTRTLLEAEDWKGASDSKAAVRKHISKFGEVLALATKSNFVAIVQLLVEAGVNIDYQDGQGETALHVAARFGLSECAEALLVGSGDKGANTEITENTFGWTPLLVACVDGHLSIVELLITAGADLAKADNSGWTAKEHAALRGHMEIARRLAELTAAPCLCGPGGSLKPSSPSKSQSLADRKSSGVSNGNSNGMLRTTEPIKTFGHRYLTNESMILVSLGTMDIRKTIDVVKLDRIPLADAHSTQLDTALSVVVSATGANGESSIIDLPVQDSISTEPVVFTALDASKVKLLFDIVPTYAGSRDQIVGRGVALLSSIKPDIGSKRINLQGDVTIPIMAAQTLEVIGSVHFNFLVITPFKHPNMSITENQTYWKSMSSTMVIGHRGDLYFGIFSPIHLLIFVKGWVKTWLLERHCNWVKILSK